MKKVTVSLETHLYAPVLWHQSMEYFAACDVIVELGPGDKLSKMLKRVWPDKAILSINTREDIEQALMLIGKPVARHVHAKDCDQAHCAQEDIVIEEKQKKPDEQKPEQEQLG